jgi:hypothetical protein
VTQFGLEMMFLIHLGHKIIKYMKEIINLPVDHYLQLIKDNKPFSFSRFGDGEVLCMFHDDKIIVNADGSHFIDELVEPMKRIFINQYDYYHCLLQCSFMLKGDIFEDFINTTCPDMPFYWGELFYSYLEVVNIVNVISPHKPCFIGGPHIKNLRYMIGINDINFIEIPSVDAFKKFDDILNSIKKEYEKGGRMFCFCAGYSTKILIDTLFPIIGHDAFMIDFGSAFDPYCGILSRSGHQSDGFEAYQPYTNYKLL